MDDFEAYDVNRSYICKLVGLRNIVSSGLNIYSFPC